MKLLELITTKKGAVIFFQIAFGLCTSLFLFLIFFELTESMLEQEFTQFDTIASQLVYTFRNPTLTSLMHFVSFLGSDFTLFFLGILSIIMLPKNHKKETFIFIIAIIIGLTLNVVLKGAIQRPRPTIDPLITETFSSFPSGHAMNAFIFYGLLTYYSYHFFRSKRIMLVTGILSAVIVGLTGLSRVYLGVHYPTDVLAGYVAGFWWFVTIILLDKMFIFYKLFKQSE